MTHWRIYEPITRVSCYLDGIASLSDLQVTACVDGRTPTPITIAMSSCTVSLSVEKSAELRAQLERAEMDVSNALLCPGVERADG